MTMRTATGAESTTTTFFHMGAVLRGGRFGSLKRAIRGLLAIGLGPS